ncbi:MAG: gephyrin-like molybdotransferase Glp, partial [Gemmataceae bacterium]
MTMIDVVEARARVLEQLPPKRVIRCRVGPDLLNLPLAEDVSAETDSPPFTKSMMDGYAVRAAETGARPVQATVAAGEGAAHTL